MSEHQRQVLVGLIALTLFFALAAIGVKAAFGAFRPTYTLEARFAAAGQGLTPGSDVRIRGVNVGEVRRVELDRGRALVTLAMNRDERVPHTVRAVVRPKTLFGEKFIDLEPGDAESTGPYLADGDEIADTLGGFELEQVLVDAYPVLEAIDPVDLAVIISSLAEGAEGMGERVNRTIVNFQQLTALQVRRDGELRRFLADFAALSDELANRAEDLVAGARDLSAALPVINERGDELVALLDQTARLSTDVADLLDANRPFLRRSIDAGNKSLTVLHEEREQIGPLVRGLRQFTQLLTEAIRIDAGDGTLLAAVKSIPGGDPCGYGQGVECLLAPAEDLVPAEDGGVPPPGPVPPLPPLPLPEVPLDPPVVPVPDLGGPLRSRSGASGIVALLEDLLR